jgi:hypothetical protein
MRDRNKPDNAPKELEPFKPSWFDQFTILMDRLPGPYWLAYLLLGLVLVGIGLLIQFFDDTRIFMRFEPLELLILFQIVFVLTLITFLNKYGIKVLETFRPVFSGTEDEAALLKLHLTSMPSRSINRLSVIYLLVYSVLGYLILRYSGSPALESQSNLVDYVFTRTPFGYYTIVIFAILWLVNFIFIYNTFHQLRVIHYALTHKAEIKLFRQTELYAFSRILAARSIGFVITSPIWLVVDRGVVTLIINIVFSILALLIFIVPLIGVHRLLESQKDVLLLESSENKESLIYQLLDHLRQENMTEAGGLKDSLSSVTLAHDEITKVSTWPWQTNTIRQIAGAITLPIFIWTIQYFLGKLLGE